MTEFNSLEEIAEGDRDDVRMLSHDGQLATGLRQFERVYKRPPRRVGEADPTDYLALTYEQLLEDRGALDRAVRTVMINEDLDYVPALERLGDWFATAGERATEPVTLDDAISRNFGDPRTYRRDLERFEARDQEAEAAIVADDSIAPDPGGEVNDRGYVVLASADEGATLLMDAQTQEAAYLNAIALDEAQPGEDGRKEFFDLLRMHVESGLNWPATLQRQRREAELQTRRREAEDQATAWADRERRRRAEERAAAAAVNDAHDRLQRSRSR